MSDLVKSDEFALAQTYGFDAISKFEESIRKTHDKASKKKTNPNHVKQKAGMDYVEFNYMRNQVNDLYPIWSTKNLQIKHELINSGWVAVQLELHWIDNGVPRQGVSAAAHRIAFKSNQERVPENIVDLSNDVKAAVTDALKKAFNTYLNISDDIYRNIEIEPISKDQRNAMYKIIEDCEPSQQKAFYNFVDNSTTTHNFGEISLKLLGAYFKYQSTIIGDSKAKEEAQKHKETLNKLGANLD